MKKPRATWSAAMVDDLVDIVVSNEHFTKKLLKEVTNASTGEVYNEVVRLLVERHKDAAIDVTQARTRFKSCVRIVSKVCYLYSKC